MKKDVRRVPKRTAALPGLEFKMDSCAPDRLQDQRKDEIREKPLLECILTT